MAYCKIIPIKVTLGNCINYVMSDKDNMESEDIDNTIEYATGNKFEDGNVYETITNTINCTRKFAKKEMESIRNNYKKKNVNLGYHLIQNFGVSISPHIANEIGVKLAKELFPNFQVIISTHTNTDNTHNHIVLNTCDIHGKNYYNNNSTYREIRKASDKLCVEYGLPVMEATKNYIVVSYKNEKGENRFFEPTQRKKEKLYGNEIQNPNDYRNSKNGQKEYYEHKSNSLEIKETIEKYILFANSYEELLELLKGEGYSISDKTKKGEWREHITFKAPNHKRGTRDKTLGEEYERENLTNRILNKVVKEVGKSNRIYKQSDYVYGLIDIKNLNYEYQYYDIDKKRKRTEIEKYILSEIKDMNKELNSEYRNTVRINFYKNHNKIEKINGYSNYEMYLLNSVNNSLRALRLMEDKNIYSLSQINKDAIELFEKRNEILKNYTTIKKQLSEANKVVTLIKNYKSLKQDESKISELNEKMIDKKLCDLGLNTVNERNIYLINFSKNYNAYKELSNQIQAINKQIEEFDNCVFSVNDTNKRNQTFMQNGEIQQYISETKPYRFGYVNKENDKIDIKASSIDKLSKEEKEYYMKEWSLYADAMQDEMNAENENDAHREEIETEKNK